MKYDVTSCVIRLLTSVIFLALSSNFDYHTRRHVSIVHPSWTFSKVVEAAGAQLNTDVAGRQQPSAISFVEIQPTTVPTCNNVHLCLCQPSIETNSFSNAIASSQK